MDFVAFKTIFSPLIERNNLVVSDSNLEKLFQYFSITQLWGSKMNVTRNMKPKDYICENIIDPLLAFESFNLKNTNFDHFVDYGSGGGYVGLTAAIIFPNLFKVILVESVRKKVSFIDKVIRELQLTNAIAHNLRAEDFKLDANKTLYVSRATWAWGEFVKIVQPQLKGQSAILSFEGRQSIDQTEFAPNQIFSYNLQPLGKKRFLYYLENQSL